MEQIAHCALLVTLTDTMGKPHTCRYGENWYGPGWAPGELFRPSRDVCAMPFSATDVREETLHTYANVTVRAGCAEIRASD